MGKPMMLFERVLVEHYPPRGPNRPLWPDLVPMYRAGGWWLAIIALAGYARDHESSVNADRSVAS